jgi:cytochrome c biogenesis protein CcdA/thioredoxin-related protein
MKTRNCLLTVFGLLAGILSFAQEPASAFRWDISSKKISEGHYEIIFHTSGNPAWQLYAPNQDLGDVPTTEVNFGDSSIRFAPPFQDSGSVKTEQSSIFEMPVKLFDGPVRFSVQVQIVGRIPETLQGKLLYTYGRGDEIYPGTMQDFTVRLEGGVSTAARINIPTIDVKNPANPCGDVDATDKSLFSIFLLGFLGGLIALITPCVFPLIPLTVSFFTKKSGTRKRGLRNAFLYGLSIFLIYALLSVPFHLLNKVNPEVLNNISTNVWLNLAFFVVFIFFALSFFGLYEIGLPGGFASKIDSRAGLSDIWGIFFMALTLAIVSFSCTGPILGSLLAGVLSNNNGATQLSFGMSGFGLGLALPFALFALFPNWLQRMPKSGGWLNTVKVVLGFLELALAVKFLSNADLVEQWGFLKREIFIAIWVVLGLLTVLYLAGIIRFAHDSPPKFTRARIFFIVLFSVITFYLLPGISNTRMAKLSLISGFPPPFSYSVYKNPVNYESGVKPLENDYEKALELARAQNKPLLIDFTGWACVNCRRMEENVWTDPVVKALMKDSFVVVSLYVDERNKLPLTERMEFRTRDSVDKQIITVGDKWATFQSENFFAVSQPQYAIIGARETALTKTKTYTPAPEEFTEWLKCGLEAFNREKAAK